MCREREREREIDIDILSEICAAPTGRFRLPAAASSCLAKLGACNFRGSGWSVVHCVILACIRQHSSAYVSIRQHTPAYVSICQHTSAYISVNRTKHPRAPRQSSASEDVRIHQHTSACQHTSAYFSNRQKLTFKSSVVTLSVCGVEVNKASAEPRSNTSTCWKSADHIQNVAVTVTEVALTLEPVGLLIASVCQL